MVIEPRQVEPGAIRRWSRDAIRLIRRGFFFWLALMLLMCLCMFFGQRWPIVNGMLGLAAFFASILVAAKLDRSEPTTLSDITTVIRDHVGLVGAFVLITGAIGALIWALLQMHIGVPWWSPLYTERYVVQVLSGDWLIATRQIFSYSAFALGLTYFGVNIPGITSFFQFPASALLGLPWHTALRLSADGQAKNFPAMLSLGLMFIALPVLLILWLPILIPLLYCFLASLCYLSFRDIFLGISENHALAEGKTLAARASA
jgi:hypothetical protein